MINLKNIKFSRQIGILVGGALVVIVVIYLLMAPLLAQMNTVGQEVKILEQEMAAARQAIKLKEKFPQTGALLTRKKISLTIDEITKTGARQNINFLSISPQQVVKQEGSKYLVLPIQMDVESEYQDFALFLGSLEKLGQSIVAVKNFEIDVDRDILPRIRTSLVVEIYLKEGEDG